MPLIPVPVRAPACSSTSTGPSRRRARRAPTAVSRSAAARRSVWATPVWGLTEHGAERTDPREVTVDGMPALMAAAYEGVEPSAGA